MTCPKPRSEPTTPGIFPVRENESTTEQHAIYANCETESESNEDRPQCDVADHE